MKRKILLWLIAAIPFVVLIGLFIKASGQKPPVEEIRIAGSLVAKAEKLQAGEYSNELFTEAKAYYDSAMICWNAENERNYLFRNYSRIRELASMSASLARASAELAGVRKSQTGDLLEKRLKILQEKIDDFDRIYGLLPLNSGQRKELSNGKLLLHEARISWEKSNFQACSLNIGKAEEKIGSINDECAALIRDYFSSFSEWENLAENAVMESKKLKTSCIIVDKMARECLLYKSGKLTATYRVELGSNWIGDKKFQGDKSTPEGKYKITGKKSGGQTKFYKALLINYPNEEDVKRFEANKASGNIERNARIGNLIEIHGHGGKGADWTDGCVALTDSDMDNLFKSVQVGTPVIIIGSLNSLNEILNINE